MEGRFLFKSRRLQLASAIAYAAATGFAVISLLADKSALAVPFLMIALGAPLVFRLVPRNYFYDMRSARSLWTDEATWYRQNVIAGVVMVLAGAIWLAVLAVR